MTRRERLRLWEIGCAGIDAVLWTSFDWDELLNLDPFFLRVREDHALRALEKETVEHLIFAEAHKMCHWQNPVSKKMQKCVSIMHEKAVDRVEKIQLSEDTCGCADISFGLEEEADLPGALWALLSDPCAIRRRHGSHLVQRVSLRAMKSWLAGRQVRVES